MWRVPRYATFCTLAGVYPTDTKAAQHPGIPPIDSISHWHAIATGGCPRILTAWQNYDAFGLIWLRNIYFD